MVGNEEFVEEIDVLQDEVVSHKNTACKTDDFSLSSDCLDPEFSDLFDLGFPTSIKNHFSVTVESEILGKTTELRRSKSQKTDYSLGKIMGCEY